MEILLEIWSKILALFDGTTSMNFTSEGIPMVIMWAFGGLLIYLAIAKDMEPTLLYQWALVQFS